MYILPYAYLDLGVLGVLPLVVLSFLKLEYKQILLVAIYFFVINYFYMISVFSPYDV